LFWCRRLAWPARLSCPVVGDDRHPRRYPERGQGPPSSVIDMDARWFRRGGGVEGARPVELAVPDHHAPCVQDRALVSGGDRAAVTARR